MFDLITGQTRHIPSKPALPVLISVSTQVALVTAVIVPVLFFTGALPEVPTMMAFVADAPSAPPPPSPPPAPPSRQAARAQAQPTPSPDAAPVEPPASIAPERPTEAGDIGVPDGVEGGVPGGVMGGIVGGVVGGLPGDIPPPPPPPAPRAPIRVGGQIDPPALVHRVEPVYPDAAVSARFHGVVIVEAQVNKDGRVVEVTVLRSGGRLLDDSAMTAVRQWRYRPLILNGQPQQFVLTVVLTFKLQDS